MFFENVFFELNFFFQLICIILQSRRGSTCYLYLCICCSVKFNSIFISISISLGSRSERTNTYNISVDNADNIDDIDNVVNLDTIDNVDHVDNVDSFTHVNTVRFGTVSEGNGTQLHQLSSTSYSPFT